MKKSFPFSFEFLYQVFSLILIIIVVHAVYVGLIRPKADDKHYLRVARWSSIFLTLAGIALVPLFMRFKSIYVAHGSFTAAVTPPMIVTILMAAFWKRYHSRAAFLTLIQL